MDQSEVDAKLKSIKSSFHTLSTSYDILVIEGCNNMNYLSSLGMSTKELISEFNAELILLVSVSDETYLDEVVLGISYFNPVKIGGVIITMVPLELIERVKFLVGRIEGLGAKVLGIIPEKSDLTAPTAREVCESIGAHVLSGKDYLDERIVEDYKVVAMDIENALKIMRKSINKAVIVGGDRPTLAIAAMETDTSLVILTGGIHPPVSLLSLSEEKKIPIALVQMDTYSLVQYISLNPVQGVLSILQTDRVESWMKIISSLHIEQLIS